jgi:hypothetical protein
VPVAFHGHLHRGITGKRQDLLDRKSLLDPKRHREVAHVVPSQLDFQFVAERLEMPAHRVGVIGNRSILNGNTGWTLPGDDADTDASPSPPINPLIEIAQNAGGDAPDVTRAEGDRIIGAVEALPFAAVLLVVRRLHQKGERHLERLVHLAAAEHERETRLHARDHRHDAIAERRHIDIEIAERRHVARVEADLLFRLAQRAGERRRASQRSRRIASNSVGYSLCASRQAATAPFSIRRMVASRAFCPAGNSTISCSTCPKSAWAIGRPI